MGLEDREPKTQFAESAVSRFFAFKRSLGALTLFGVFLVLLAQPHNVFPGYLNQIAQVQSGLALSALFIYLYGVVVATWRSVKIDYVAAFQFKLSSALIETQVWNVAAVLSVVLGTSVGINLAIHDKKLWPDSLPVFIAYFFFVGVLTVPVKLFYRPTRMYLLLTLVQLEYGLCFFLSGNFTATTNPLFQNCGVGTTHHLVAQPIMFSLSSLSFELWQHAVNAGKYVSCVLLVGASTLDTDEDLRHPFRWTKFRYIWLAAVIVKTSYCYVWDILFDWGLGSPQYGFLRKVRFFQDKRVYYFAIFTNLVRKQPPQADSRQLGRISWSFAISPHQCPPDWIVTLSTIEIFRRAQWAVYRVENFVIESGSTPDLEKPFLHTTAESPTSAAETPTTDATHGSSGFLLPRLSTDESDLERRAT